MAIRYATIGNLTTDDLVYFDGSRDDRLPGGGTLYGALAALLWTEEQAGIISVIGDAYDRKALRRFRDHGIDLTAVEYVPGVEGILDCLVYLDPKGETKNILFPGKSSTRAEMTPLPTSYPAFYRNNVKGYHLPSCSVKETADWLEVIPKDAVTVGDPFVEDSDTEEDIARMMAGLTCFLPSERELAQMFGCEQPKDPADYLPLLRSIATEATEVICVKLGGKGALVFDVKNGKAWVIPPYPAKVVNVTGCGDSFCGGFLAGYEQTRDAFTAAMMGTVSSSFVIEHLLSIDILSITKEQARARLAEYKTMADREKNRIL